MSSASRLNMLVDSAYKNEDITGVRDAFSQYYNCNCLHPIKQKIFDAHTQTYRDIFVNCGKCEHCRQTKINEWCTRMYAHAEDFKHIYFVTLTYRSFYDDQRLVNRLMLDKLKAALWHKDSFNSTKHLAFSPCLLVKKHYQDFLKRLRKNTGLADITYVLSGEYGHDYGRPHFHMILFTNGVLTKHDIDRAWSVALWQNNDTKEVTYKTSQKNNGKAHYFSIGRVDFHDLVTNGTFNTTAKIKVDGTFMNASNCFSYVCKYVCKSEDANLNRVKLAYSCLFNKQRFTRIFEKEIQFNIVRDYMRSVGYNFEQIDNIINNNKLITYEKILFQPHDLYGMQDTKNVKTIRFNDLVFHQPIFDENYFEFCNSFKPFCEFSRGTPIGSVYASRNISQFKEDIFTKPLLQESGFVVPSYFRRKAKESLYGLRKASETFSGIHFGLYGLPDLYRRFSESLKSEIPLAESYRYKLSDEQIEKALYNPSKLFSDFSTGEKVVLHDDCASHFKYDRHSRKYINTRNIPVADWLRFWVTQIADEIYRNNAITEISRMNMAALERSQLIALDLGEQQIDLKNRFTQMRDDIKRAYADLYHSVHASAE